MAQSFKPTVEQDAVVDAVLGGGDLKIKAYTGAGKTSTLRLIAEHARRGFPSNVSARTVHSLAYASIAPALTARESPGRCTTRISGPLWARTSTGAAPDPRGRSATAPDVYLKVWGQTEPRIDADFILFDDAQDSDGVMLSVLGLQREAQIIYVGDPYQQIHKWSGAVNAMAQIDVPERALRESFRFGLSHPGVQMASDRS